MTSLSLQCHSGATTSTPEDTPPEEEAPEKCTGLALPNGFGASIKLGPLTFNAKCEKLGVSVSGLKEIPGISAFAEASYSKKGYTLFGGSKGSLGIPLPGGGEVSLGAKSGFYMTFDRSGEVQDYGWRVSPPSVSAQYGQLTYSVWGGESMDFSFVGITDYMPFIGTK